MGKFKTSYLWFSAGALLLATQFKWLVDLLDYVDTGCKFANMDSNFCGSKLVIVFLTDPPGWFILVSLLAATFFFHRGLQAHTKEVLDDRLNKIREEFAETTAIAKAAREWTQTASAPGKPIGLIIHMLRKEISASNAGNAKRISALENTIRGKPDV